MSDFISLYTAFSGLTAAQAGINTASHNVANASTVGYTRQQVDLVSRTPYHQRFGTVGQGVHIAGITRSRVAGLDAQVRSSAATQGHLDVLANLLAGTEAVMGEPDTGVTASMADLWTSFDELMLDPPNASARQHVITSLDRLTTTISGVAEKWDIEATSASNSLSAYVDRTNAMLRDVADLNRQILNASGLPGEPNDLLDQRDILMDELANIAGVTVMITDNGAARVSLDGLSLVSDTMVSELSYDNSTYEISHSSGAAVDVGGELSGFQSYLQTELPGFQNSLNTFARELADALNAQHSAGFTPDGSSGGNLLNYTVGKEAISLTVAVTHHSEIAAAGNSPVAEFDGINAEALSALRQVLVADGGTITLDDAMRNVVSYVGEMTAAAASGARSQAALTSQAENARTQTHGVSIDEEMVNLITYQRAYEAAARVMTAVDQNLDTLINRTGVVGR
ncbi:MAG: flagellar hook-associated protein FlgK [bacterium]|nr:flagellar hook-associated protein FlgK [bacterium]